MRFDRLDLISYGKFTHHSLELPPAERDFHVIVGPNEAGKSTVRAAILDLLYGIPKNTVHAFLHEMSDMRLGARIAHQGQVLEFQRLKGNKQTLRDAAGQALPDGALTPYLETTDKDFFAQMFGLDHERLVAGGHSILSASNDLGQMLFQSAAGIGSLGAVREALEAEAEKLWSRRRSSERLYYIASDELERAAAALKAATVRTRDWSDAQARLTAVEGAYAQVRREHAAVKARRGVLERVRRVLPHLLALDDAEARIAALGAVAALPDTAAATLRDAQLNISLTQAEIDHQTGLLRDAQAALNAVHPDQRMRELAAEITELNEQRLQYRGYGASIDHRQAEIDAQWRVVATHAAELGWPVTTEEAARAHMPPPAVRSALGRLLRQHAVLKPALDGAVRVEQTAQAALAAITGQLDRLVTVDAPVGLSAALAQAQRLGDVEASLRERRQLQTKREVALDAALAALGKGKFTVDVLRAMSIPAPESINEFIRLQVADDAQLRALRAAEQTLVHQLEMAAIEITQYRGTHAPVTREQVLDARRQRQQIWDAMKADASRFERHAGPYQQSVAAADALADGRHDTAQQASELLSRQHDLARRELELAAQRQQIAALQAAGAARAEKWQMLAVECALPALSVQALVPWLASRQAALLAADALLEARLALQVLLDARDDARTRLGSALLASNAAGVTGGAGGPGDPGGTNGANGANGADATAGYAPLEELIEQAAGYLSMSADVRGQRRTLEQQLADKTRELAEAATAAATARAEFDVWQTKWRALAADAGLDVPSAELAQADLAAAEASLEIMATMQNALDTIRETRVHRIDKMQADLRDHAAAALALAERAAPDLSDESAAAIALGLASRLAAANQAHEEAERQRSACQTAARKLDDAISRQKQALAALAPLHEQAHTISGIELAAAIERSDQRHVSLATAAAAAQQIRQDGDGLSIEQLRAEVAQVDATLLTGELDDLAAQDEALVQRLTELSQQRQVASTALDAIGGSGNAAQAEGRRQEALASMTDIVERYVKVFTAARLLKWSIEQYREARQGPMLASASSIFARLTLGSFDKLAVDFDSEPLKLLGRRANGALVAIDGMSEGTRDQLYLALRLAALDMHLGQAHVLPFIADDLFINYDDRRSKAGLEALGELSRKTQVLFLTHHDHLLPTVREVFGANVNVVELSR
ncbi:MAG: AAA family ATPase [Janthinobacterium lividum]